MLSQNQQHKRIHILNGMSVDVKPPNSHYVLNENGEKDDSGQFVIPDRLSDAPPQKPALNIAPLMDRFPELQRVFDEGKPRTLPTVQTQLHCLTDVVEQTEHLIRNRIDDYRTKQSAQTKALHAFVAHIKKQVKQYEDYLDDSMKMLQDLKTSARTLPDPEEIKKSCGTVIRDISGRYDTLEKYINKADLEVANNYIQRYLNDENNEMEEGVSAASKNFHHIKNRILNVEEGNHYLSATNLEGDLYNYNDTLAQIHRLQADRKSLVRQFEQQVSQLEKVSAQPNEYRSLDMELRNRDWLRELQENDEQLLGAVQDCESKKFRFDTHILNCVRALIDVYSDLRQDLNDPSIPDRFKKAQQHLKYITFATNLKAVYSACMVEMNRRINDFGETFRQQIAAFNETTETIVQEENRKRSRFLDEQKKLLGGAELPASLVPGVTEKLNIPKFEPVLEEDELQMGEHVKENQDLLEFSILNDPNESNIFDANFNPHSLRAPASNTNRGTTTGASNNGTTAQSVQAQQQQEIITLQHHAKQQEAVIHEHNQTIARLREQLSQTRGTLKDEVSSREIAEKKITDLLSSISDIQDSKRSLEGEVEDLTHKLSDANAEITILKANLKTAANAHKESFNAELNSRMEQLSSRLVEVKKQYEQSQKDLRTEQHTTAQLKSENASLSEYTQAMRDELDRAGRDLTQTKNSFTAEHRKWFGQEQELKQKLQTAQMKHHDLTLQMEKISQLVIDKQEENNTIKVQLQKKQKEIDDLMQKHSNNASQLETSLKKTIAELKVIVQEKDHKITRLEQNVRRSARAVDAFKASVRNSFKNAINHQQDQHTHHMRAIAQLKSSNSSATRDILIILKKQLEHSAQAISKAVPVLSSIQDAFPEMDTICALFTEPCSTIMSVCGLMDTITSGQGKDAFLEQSVASPNLEEQQNPTGSRFAMGNFKPRDNVLFCKVKDKQGLFEAITEADQGDGQYFLDPDSYTAFCSLAEGNKNKESITGEVIQVIERSANDDPLKLRRNYKTLLVAVNSE